MHTQAATAARAAASTWRFTRAYTTCLCI